MGWSDRRYEDDGGGRGRDVLRRIFGDGENPLDWSLPLYTAWGIRVRLSLIYAVYIAVELIMSLSRGRWGLELTATTMGTLFALVLFHEYGHCLACRWVGGTADRILMWPLGGLAYCIPPHQWFPSLITTLGGPAVNVVLVPALGLPLVALAGWDAVLFNPFAPGQAWMGVHLSNGLQPFWLFALWSAYLTNLALLAFNMLLPMYPMDAGRVLQELLWRKMGYHRATSIAATVGMAMAGIVLIFAMVSGETLLFGIAIFCGATSWMEKRRLAATVEDPAMAGYDFSRGFQGMPADEPSDERSAEKRRKQEQAEQERLDAILAKIARSGMGSLSWRERSWLRRTTEKRRRG
ncbi:MAG: site-2 protease family protein [Phycisphaerales bacterium]